MIQHLPLIEFLKISPCMMCGAREQAQHAANSYDTSVQWVQHYEHSEDHVAFGMECPVFAVRCTWVNRFCSLVHLSCKSTSQKIQYISQLCHITFSLRITSSKALIGPIRKPGFRPAAKCLAVRRTQVAQVSQRRTLQRPSMKSQEAAPTKPQIKLSFVAPVAHGLWGNHLCAAHEASAGLCNLIAFLQLD